MTTEIRNRIAVGAGWTVSLRWVDRVIGLVSIAILARLLLPVDFGLVGYAMVFLGILAEFSMFSFQTVLIRDQDATQDKYDTAWTLEIIKGLILATIIIASAKAVAAFFKEPKVEEILYWIAVIPILRGVANVGIVDFEKHLELHKDFFLNSVVQLASTITTVVLALLLRNYWALVIGAVFRAILRVILSYVMSDYRPRLCLSESSRVLGFSKWMLVQNIFFSINTRLPVIVIGRVFNAQALAFFNMAKELTGITSTQFAAPIRRALYPGITKMQGDHSEMATTVTSALGIIVLLGLPAAIGIGITAPLFVSAFLGNNWISVAPIMQVLSLNAAIQLFYPNSNVIFYALNRPKVTAVISALRLCLLVPAILLIVPEYGALGAAWTIVAVNSFVIVVDYVILFHMTSVSLMQVVAATWRSALGVVVMAACVTFVVRDPYDLFLQDSTVLHFALCVASGVISYITIVSMLWLMSGALGGPEANVIRTLRNIYNGKTFSGLKSQN